MSPQKAMALVVLMAVALRAAGDDAEFVRSSCGQLQSYPEVCVKMMMPYSATFAGDVGKMALKAAELMQTQAEETSDYISKVEASPVTKQKLAYMATDVKWLATDNGVRRSRLLVEMVKKLVPKPQMPMDKFKTKLSSVQSVPRDIEFEIDMFLGRFNVPDSPIKSDITARFTDTRVHSVVFRQLISIYALKA